MPAVAMQAYEKDYKVLAIAIRLVTSTNNIYSDMAMPMILTTRIAIVVMAPLRNDNTC